MPPALNTLATRLALALPSVASGSLPECLIETPGIPGQSFCPRICGENLAIFRVKPFPAYVTKVSRNVVFGVAAGGR
jgi:hypothetical protein